MTDGKTPDPSETIIELVEAVNWAYVFLAFVAGAVIVAGIVYYMGRNAIAEESNDA